MLKSVGIVAPPHQNYWMETIRADSTQRISPPFSEQQVSISVDVWLVVPDAIATPSTWRTWLQRLNAPILLVTSHLATAIQLTNVLSRLTIICHPLRAENRLNELLYLASEITSGTGVLSAPNVRLVERANVQRIVRQPSHRRRLPAASRQALREWPAADDPAPDR